MQIAETDILAVMQIDVKYDVDYECTNCYALLYPFLPIYLD